MAEAGAVPIAVCVARFLSCDVSTLTDADLSVFVLDGEALRQAIDAKQRDALAEFDRRGAWEGDGARSAAQWQPAPVDAARRSNAR